MVVDTLLSCLKPKGPASRPEEQQVEEEEEEEEEEVEEEEKTSTTSTTSTRPTSRPKKTMSIQPISHKLPSSKETWEDSYLPLCVVSTPMVMHRKSLGDTNTGGSDGDDDASDTTVYPASAVPKCLYCGAPLPTSATHYRPEGSTNILCYLCGEISSILIEDQQEIREDEYLDPDLYDTVDFESRLKFRRGAETNDSGEDDEHELYTDTIELRVPIMQKTPQTEGRENGKHETGPRQDASLATWRLPAMACPPIWWIVVDGTVGNATSIGATRNYWTTVGATLKKTLEGIPPHVHVGLLTATASRLASWDLTSAIPHILQFPFDYDPSVITDVEGGGEGQTNENTELEDDSNEAWDFCLVPANGHYKPNIEAAIRAMVDGAISGHFLEGSSGDGETEDEDGAVSSQNVPLGLTIEILLDFMNKAIHPGEDDGNDDDDDDDDDDMDDNGLTKLRYAGGKILYLMGSPPLETGIPPKADSMSYLEQPSFGFGGVSGACRSEEGHQKKTLEAKGFSLKNGTKKETKVETDHTDLTPTNLKDYTLPLDPDDVLHQIGSRCAKAALGVDLIVLVPEEDDDETEGYIESKQAIPWYGLPLLRPLSEASGAPGPLMFGTANIGSFEDGNDTKKTDKDKFERLFDNVKARTPWQPGMAFGAQMRVRLSPGMKLEDTPVTSSFKKQLNLSCFLTSGGISGPATRVVEDETDDEQRPDEEQNDVEGYLFAMGSCDPYTSFSFDLDYDGEGLPEACETEEFGDVPLKPLIQTCTLYTCIEKDGVGNYYTVCRLRVSSITFDFADDFESILDSLNIKALSSILMNKMFLDAYLVGFREAQSTAESWLQRFMVAAYESAEEQMNKLEEEAEEKEGEEEKAEEEAEEKNEEDQILEKDNIHEDQNINHFVANDRLLDVEGGTLEDTDVLVGGGHFKAKHLPHLVYGIIQSDALRPCGRGFSTSMDARLCAITQLASMNPTALTKCLIPTISLWSLNDDTMITDSLPLSKEGILEVLEDLGKDKPENTVILLNSTRDVILLSTDNLKEKGTSSKNQITIGPNLEYTIGEALSGYRTSPTQSDALRNLLNDEQTGSWKDFKVPESVLRLMLLEDMPTFAGDENFQEWKSRMAEGIFEELDENEEEEVKTGSGFSRLFGV